MCREKGHFWAQCQTEKARDVNQQKGVNSSRPKKVFCVQQNEVSREAVEAVTMATQVTEGPEKPEQKYP